VPKRVTCSGRIQKTEDAIGAAGAIRDQLSAELVVITLGKNGAVAVHNDRTVLQPAFHSELVDTVGAGEAFLGMLTASVIMGESIEEAMRRASDAGALAVGRRGAYDALPDWTAVDAFLAARP
jgi:ribokinase